MITDRQLRSIQKLGEKFMTTTVSISHRESFAKDPSAVFGDDVVEYEPTPTVTKGWLSPMPQQGFDIEGAQIVSVGDFKLRVPVGTRIGPGDRVTIDGAQYSVAESTSEQTWPEWTTAFLRRIV